jgi:hypothetical protein
MQPSELHWQSKRCAVERPPPVTRPRSHQEALPCAPPGSAWRVAATDRVRLRITLESDELKSRKCVSDRADRGRADRPLTPPVDAGGGCLRARAWRPRSCEPARLGPEATSCRLLSDSPWSTPRLVPRVGRKRRRRRIDHHPIGPATPQSVPGSNHDRPALFRVDFGSRRTSSGGYRTVPWYRAVS